MYVVTLARGPQKQGVEAVAGWLDAICMTLHGSHWFLQEIKVQIWDYVTVDEFADLSLKCQFWLFRKWKKLRIWDVGTVINTDSRENGRRAPPNRHWSNRWRWTGAIRMQQLRPHFN